MTELRESQQDLHMGCIQRFNPNKGPCPYLKPLQEHCIPDDRQPNGPLEFIKVEKCFEGRWQSQHFEYAVQTPFPMVGHQNDCQMPPYGTGMVVVPNTTVYTPMPVDNWPNCNPIIGVPGISIYIFLIVILT